MTTPSLLHPLRMCWFFLACLLTLVGVSGAMAQDNACVFCTDCSDGSAGGNMAFGEGHPLAVNSIGGGVHPGACVLSGYCESTHPEPCNVQTDVDDTDLLNLTLADLREAPNIENVRRGFAMAMEPQYADRIYYSPSRHALQARGCRNMITLHIPLAGWRTSDLVALIVGLERDHYGRDN